MYKKSIIFIVRLSCKINYERILKCKHFYERFGKIRGREKQKEITAVQVIKKSSVKKTTLYKLVEQHESTLNMNAI